MRAGGTNGGGELLCGYLVPAQEDVDVGEVAVACRGVASVDHGDDLLGENGRQRIADEVERLVQECRVAHLHGRGRDRITDADVDAQRVSSPVDASWLG
jgi:hypothetical protein